MVRLTPELIQQAMQYINSCQDREINLRGYRIPVIENLGTMLDQFDTIDFSDNDIRKLDGFPYMKRLNTLIFNNNAIVKISDGLHDCIPNLQTLVLTGNLISDLSDIDALHSLSNLRVLILLNCPITHKQHYRLYVIFKLPQLKVLDFRKIKEKERVEAKSTFKSKKGKELQKEISGKPKQFIPGAGLANNVQKPTVDKLEEIKKIREAISKASSLEEVERLNLLLQSGQIPGKNETKENGKGSSAMEVEEEEEEEQEKEEEHEEEEQNGKMEE